MDEIRVKNLSMMQREKRIEPILSESQYIDIMREVGKLWSKIDPPAKPFESKYKARERLLSLQEQILKEIDCSAGYVKNPRSLLEVSVNHGQGSSSEKLSHCYESKADNLNEPENIDLTKSESDYSIKSSNSELWLIKALQVSIELSKNYMETEEPSSAEAHLCSILHITDPKWFKKFENENSLTKPSQNTPAIQMLTEAARPLVQSKHSLWDSGTKTTCDFVALITPVAYKDLAVLWAAREGKEFAERALIMLERAASFLLDRTDSAMKTSGPISNVKPSSSSVDKTPCSSSGYSSTHHADLSDPKHCLTLVYYYLAQVHTALNQSHQGALYCSKTLLRQQYDASYDPFRWATDCVGLSSYWHSIFNYQYAYILVQAARKTLLDLKRDDKSSKCSSGMKGQKEEDDDLTLKVKALIDREEGLLFSGLLGRVVQLYHGEHTPEELLDEEASCIQEDASILSLMSSTNHARSDYPTTEEESAMPHHLPPLSLKNFHLPFSESSGATANRMTNTKDKEKCIFNRALVIFKNSFYKLEHAKNNYYKLEGHVTEHIKLLREQSRCFNHLAAFEVDPKRKAAMHIRREHLLKDLIPKLNKKFYLTELQELTYELGGIMDQVTEAHEERAAQWRTHQSLQQQGKPLTTTRISDLKRVTESSLAACNHYLQFINLCQDSSKDTESPLVVPYIRAHFHVARAYGKLTVPSSQLSHCSRGSTFTTMSTGVPQEEEDFWMTSQCKSLEFYEKGVELYRALAGEEKKQYLKEEVYLCEEYSKLLAQKINSIRHERSTSS